MINLPGQVSLVLRNHNVSVRFHKATNALGDLSSDPRHRLEFFLARDQDRFNASKLGQQPFGLFRPMPGSPCKT